MSSVLDPVDNVARQRLEQLFDGGEYAEIDAMAEANGCGSNIIAGFGSISGVEAYAFSQDVQSGSGAVSVAQCKKLKKVYDLAKKTGCPIIGIYDSNGVNLNEGFDVLGEYCELVKASADISGVVLQVSVIAGSCLGTSAVVANMADVVIQLKDTDFYVTVPSEVTADDNSKSGVTDIMVTDFKEAAESVKNLVSILPANNLEGTPFLDFAENEAVLSEESDYKEIACAMCDSESVIELKAGWAENVVTALGTIEGNTVGVIAFGGEPLKPRCAYKAEAFIKLCDAYNIPIVTFIDIDSLEKQNESAVLVAITKLVSAYADTTSVKISVITKNAIGSPYVMFAARDLSADLVFAWDGAVVSPLEADAAVAFLYNDRLAAGEDRNELEAEYRNTDASVEKAAKGGEVDDVFAPGETRTKIVSALDVLQGKRETTIPRKHTVK